MSNTNLLGKVVEVPIKIVDGNLRILICAKNEKTVSSATHKLVKQAAKLEAKGYKSVLSTFTEYFKNQGVHVDVFLRESNNLRSPKTSIKYGESDGVCSSQIDPDGLIRKYGRNIGRY